MANITTSKILNAIGCVSAETALAAFSYNQLAIIAPHVLSKEVQWTCVASIFLTSFVTNASAILNPNNENPTIRIAPKSKLGKMILLFGAINTAFVFFGFSSGILYAFFSIFQKTLVSKIIGLSLSLAFSYCFSKGYYYYIVQDGKIYCDQFFSKEESYFAKFSKNQLLLLSMLMLCVSTTAIAEACFSNFIFNSSLQLYCETFTDTNNCTANPLGNILAIIASLAGGLIGLCAYPWIIFNRICPIDSIQPLLGNVIADKPKDSNWRLLAWLPILCSSLSDGMRNAFSVLIALWLNQTNQQQAISVILPITGASFLTYSIFNKEGVKHLYRTSQMLAKNCFR